MARGKLLLLPGIALAGCALLSLVHPWGDLRSTSRNQAPILEGSKAPAEVQQVMEAKCADCHSEKTQWPIYSKVAPASWLVERDVHEGREHLNLSRWQQYSLESRVDLLTKIAGETRSGQMPVQQYLLLHPSARLSTAEQQLLYDWAKSERKRLRSAAAKPQKPVAAPTKVPGS